MTNIESALADIQLLGTPEQVRLSRNFIDDMEQNEAGSLNDLLLSLRKSLREELDLEEIQDDMVFLRLDNKTILKCDMCGAGNASGHGQLCKKHHFICSQCAKGNRKEKYPICDSNYV